MKNHNVKFIAFFLAIILVQTKIMVVANKSSPESCIVINSESRQTYDTIHHVGELFAGGVIFYVDVTGQHGLICSLSDIKDPDSYRLFNRQDPKALKGHPDSTFIINMVFAVDNPEHAQELCDNYTNPNYGTGAFSDWYLPTRDELEILYRVKDQINKVLENYDEVLTDPLAEYRNYWSSTKFYDQLYDVHAICIVPFHGGSFSFLAWDRNSKHPPGQYYVRAVRSF
jgi:hypothetical protein